MFRLFGQPMLTAPQLVLLAWCLLYSVYKSWGFSQYWGLSLMGTIIATHFSLEFVRYFWKRWPKFRGAQYVVLALGLLFMNFMYYAVVSLVLRFLLMTGYTLVVSVVLLASLGLLMAAADRQWAELRAIIRTR